MVSLYHTLNILKSLNFFDSKKCCSSVFKQQVFSLIKILKLYFFYSIRKVNLKEKVVK